MKNTVVLINPGHDDEVPAEIARSFGAKSRDIPREDPPISILNLGAYVKGKGYDVRILDTHIDSDYKKTLEGLVKAGPLAIGISVILGKFTKNAISLTKYIKSLDKDVPVIWGGKLVHLAQEKILRELDVDYIVVGEGELPLVALLDAMRSGKRPDGIKGIGFKKDGSVITTGDCEMVENLDDIYQSEDFGWDLVSDRMNFKQVPYFINLYTSRGCRFNCSFCYLMDIKNMKPSMRYRRRSAENVIREIDYLNKKYGINVFTFGDDDFLCDMRKVVPILEHIRKKGMYIEHFWTNINNLTPENIDHVKGICQTVCYSIEATSPRLQKILNKRIPVEKALGVNAALREAGMNTVHNFLFGIPTETDADTKQNIALIKEMKKVNPYVRANCYILSPIPGTPIFDFAQELVGRRIGWTLDDLANFHFRYMGESAAKFRPYLSKEDNIFYERVTVLANELFCEVNSPVNDDQRREIEGSKRLGEIFGDLDAISYPAVRKKKYILNDVIRSAEDRKPLPRIEPF